MLRYVFGFLFVLLAIYAAYKWFSKPFDERYTQSGIPGALTWRNFYFNVKKITKKK